MLLGLLVILAALCLVVIVGALIAWSAHVREQEQHRRETLAAFAAHREWEYREADPALVGRFSGRPFEEGDRRRATNVFIGRHDGRAFTAFEYHFDTTSGTGSDRTTTTSTYSVVALHIGIQAPPLEVGPFGTMAKLWDRFVKSDIPVGDPAFDQAFRVKTTAPEFARDVLHPGMRQILWHHQDLSWRFAGDSMLVVESGRHGPEQIEAKLHFMDAVLDAVPDFVWDRLRGELR